MTAAFVPCPSRRQPPSVGGPTAPCLVRPTTSTTTTCLQPPPQRLSLLAGDNNIDSVLSNTDIGVGIIMALLLAALASFLQNQRSQNDFVLGPIDIDEATSTLSVNATTTTTFEDWKEMSQPDNYVWYNTRLRNKENKQTAEPSFPLEQRWVLIALIVLFAPIFSFEFFLTVSRQLVCAISQDLCMPYNVLE